MNNKLIKYKFRNESFAGYGLNKFKNFLSAPECDCGCGGKGSLLLKDREDLFGFMYAVLMDNECNCCAVFAHAYDGNMYAAIKCISDEKELDTLDLDADDMPVNFFGVKDDYLEFFQEWDGEIGLHCYGLLIETKKGEWKIIED